MSSTLTVWVAPVTTSLQPEILGFAALGLGIYLFGLFSGRLCRTYLQQQNTVTVQLPSGLRVRMPVMAGGSVAQQDRHHVSLDRVRW